MSQKKRKSVLGIVLAVVLCLVVGIVALYLVAGFVLFPLLVPPIVKWQSGKFLARPVTLEGARFNPLTLDLKLSGLRVPDADGQTMIGFDTFHVQVSPSKLLHRQYEVLAVDLDGLNVHAVLLPDKTINLQGILPKSVPAKPAPVSATASAVVAKPSPALLPYAVIDSITLRNAHITFEDQAIGKGFTLAASPVDLSITGLSTGQDCTVKASMSATIDQGGQVALDALVKPFAKPLQAEATFTLNNYAMRALSPYTGRYTGRAVGKGGLLDVDLTYRIADNKLEASHKLLLQNFDLAEKIKSKDALHLPFGLAIALLKDTNGRIDIFLPVTGNLADPKFEYFGVLESVAVNFFMKIVESPATALAAFLPSKGSEIKQMNKVLFAPGASVLTAVQTHRLLAAVTVLKQRPGLAFKVHGGYDPSADWPVIGKGDVDQKALEALAGARAEAIQKALVGAGFKASRIKIAGPWKVVSVMQTVPSEMSLTVLEK